MTKQNIPAVSTPSADAINRAYDEYKTTVHGAVKKALVLEAARKRLRVTQ